jgi:hypothetical protein
MVHEGIGNGLPISKETIHRNKYRTCRQTQNKNITVHARGDRPDPGFYFQSRGRLEVVAVAEDGFVDGAGQRPRGEARTGPNGDLRGRARQRGAI